MDEYLQLFKEETNSYNEKFLGNLLPQKLWEPLPHILRTWLRGFISANLIYFIVGSLWCFYIYYLKRNLYFPQDDVPSMKSIGTSIKATMKAMPFFIVVPTISEFMVERGWTRCFLRVDEVGWGAYLVYVITYMVMVEFMMYWLHRGLHEIKPLYKHIHAVHHIFNKKDSISPFSGFVLHPVEGMLIVMPHVIPMLIVPTHFQTQHTLMLLSTLWTLNTHDCINGNSWPLMGAAYHTLHHTTYRNNYGYYTVFTDLIFGTLREPPPTSLSATKEI